MTATSPEPAADAVTAAWGIYLGACGEQPSIRGLRAVLDEAARETEAQRQRADKAEAALAALVLPQAFPPSAVAESQRTIHTVLDGLPDRS